MKTPAQDGRRRGGGVHFYVAAGILAAAASGFHTAKETLGVVLVKSPVPPPARVRTREQRLVSFPETIGHYRLAGDGDLEYDKRTKKPVKDGKPDGILELRHEQLDEMDITKHPLNWYYSGLFVDTTPGPLRVFQINITYYTGTLDAIPHVPEICLRAGGGKVLSEDCGDVSVALPGMKPPWDRFEIRRTAYGRYGKDDMPLLDSRGDPVKSAEYYVFSMNGKPTCSRTEMRLKLAWPLDKYCYYAKVQVAPPRVEATLAEQDAACREFLREVMPVVLEYLPSAGDVEALSRRGKH